MNNSVTAASISPVIRIGISGLPSLANCMVVGGLYILIAELPSARFPMLSGSLAGAINNGVPCTLIVPADPSSFLHRIESFGGIDAAELINADRLQVLVMQDEFRKKMFRFGADSFVEELEQFEIPDNSYLIFDQADELLSLQDISLAMEQVDVLKKWFAAKGITALLVFSRTTESHAGTLNALMDNLNGIVRLGGGGDGLELTFDYWCSPEGDIAAKRYRLQTLASGLYEISTKIAPSTSVADEERDKPYQSKGDKADIEPHFFFMEPDLSVLSEESVDLVSPLLKPRLSTSSDSEAAKRSTAVSAVSKMNNTNHNNGFNETTPPPNESSISEDGGRVVTPIFGKKQTPRATRSS